MELPRRLGFLWGTVVRAVAEGLDHVFKKKPPDIEQDTVGEGLSSSGVIRSEDFDHGGVLGAGSYGSVREATRRSDGQCVALKTITPMTPSVQQEVDIMRKVSGCCNVVSFLGSFQNERGLHIVMERLRGPNLLRYVLDRGKLCESDALRVLLQLIDALRYMHLMGIAHLDVKPDNIVLQRPRRWWSAGVGRVKLVDFGLSFEADSVERFRDHCVRGTCGTRHYAAPEMGLGQMFRPDKCDIWSAGVTLFSILTAEYLFEGRTFQEIAQKAVENGDHDFYKDRRLGHVSYDTKRLLSHMICKEPMHRYSASAISDILRRKLNCT